MLELIALLMVNKGSNVFVFSGRSVTPPPGLKKLEWEPKGNHATHSKNCIVIAHK